jgi:hypothetical protein
MKNILLSIIFVSTALFAENIIESKASELKNSQIICKNHKTLEVQRRGCCSHHGGVSGCSSGRVTCNDGTYSPSCTCYAPITPLG